MSDQRDGGIGWTDETWNPVRGCSRVSEGCRHCYAEVVAARFSGEGQPYEGLAVRKLKVVSDDVQHVESRWTGEVRVVPEHLDDPIRWKRKRRVFVNSMSDVFHEKISLAHIAAIWAVMLLSPWHTFQVLTKRAERMREVLTDPHFYRLVLRAAEGFRRARPKLMQIGISDPALFPAPWIWLGVSAENHKAAERRVPILLDTPAGVRFVSAEPLLGPIDFTHLDADAAGHLTYCQIDALSGRHTDMGRPCPSVPKLDWVIVGGESGHGARPCDVDWIRSIVAQCRGAETACFVKQLGAVSRDGGDAMTDRGILHHKGGDPAEWPEDLRVREFPEVGQ